MARESFEKAGDLSALMLLLLSIGDRDGLAKLAATARAFLLFFCIKGGQVGAEDADGYLLMQRRKDRTTWRSLHFFNWEIRTPVSISS